MRVLMILWGIWMVLESDWWVWLLAICRDFVLLIPAVWILVTWGCVDEGYFVVLEGGIYDLLESRVNLEVFDRGLVCS